MDHKVEIDFHGRPFSIEVGRLAKQASGSALVQYGETVVLATAVAQPDPRVGIDFFPLTVDYQEKTFAAGKIPGGFFKREGRQGEKEVLTSRLIDRPIRPLFPEGCRCETQIIATVLSSDKENDPDMVALIGASAALHVSDIPFLGPIAGVRVGRVDGKFVINPLISQLEESDLNLIVAGSQGRIVMVEGGAKMLSEDVMLDALYTAHDGAAADHRAAGRAAREARQAEARGRRAPSRRQAAQGRRSAGAAAHREGHDLRRQAGAPRSRSPPRTRRRRRAALREVPGAGRRRSARPSTSSRSHAMRQMIVKTEAAARRTRRRRRPADQLRGQVLPRTHGSAVFTRGETQALAATTLGTSSDEQTHRRADRRDYRKFMLHYNFPPYSVGEVKFLRGPEPPRHRPRRARRARASRRCCRTTKTSRTRSASCRRSSSRTAPRRWRRSAAAPCR